MKISPFALEMVRFGLCLICCGVAYYICPTKTMGNIALATSGAIIIAAVVWIALHLH